MSTATDASTAATTDRHDWITAKEAAQLLGIARETFLKVARLAPLHPHVPPGRRRMRYSRQDVERLAREAQPGPYQGRPVTARRLKRLRAQQA